MKDERGFTLIEILVSLAVFAMIVIGSLGVLGAADQGGFLEGFPTGFITARVAKDYTAASVYLQAFNEFVAGKGSAATTPGTYCIGSGCSPVVDLPGGLTGYPTPPGQTYQLEWRQLQVRIEQWYWDDITTAYRCAEPAGTSDLSTPPALCNFAVPIPPSEYVVRVQTKLTWTLRGTTRSVTVERFIP